MRRRDKGSRRLNRLTRQVQNEYTSHVGGNVGRNARFEKHLLRRREMQHIFLTYMVYKERVNNGVNYATAAWRTRERAEAIKALMLARSDIEEVFIQELSMEDAPQPAMCLGCEYWRMPSGGHCMRGEGVEFCFKVGTHSGVR